jgi:hypothetical protein
MSMNKGADVMFKARFALAAVLGAALTAQGADLTKGTPDIKSAGPLAFGPNGLLFVGDAQGGAIFAIDTADRSMDSSGGTIKVEGIDSKVAALLGTTPGDMLINDMAVNPTSGKAYLSISRGRGPTAAPVIVRVDRSGKVEAVSLQDVPFAKAALTAVPAAPTAPAADAPAPKKGMGGNARSQAITDLAFVDGRVYIAGLSNEQFSSRLVSIPYPFAQVDNGTSVEIYHGAHGRYETASPIRTFAPYKINGEPYLMAAYQCTPLVKFPLAALKPGTKYRGTTVAELGNRNAPLDMVVYQKGGKDYLLLANSARGVMKISTDGIAEAASISERIQDTAGQPYDKITDMKGVEQLDLLDKDNALVIVRTPNGSMNLETVPLP